jgi:aminoglycoside phosphotransferase family enzyme/predicted kinase
MASLPESLCGLLNSTAYGHTVDEIRVIETHISWVVLTGEFAYKIKRPVRFSFLDFTTLERREHFCKEELRLNHRFAPSLYLAVVPIVQTPAGTKVEAAGEVVEYAVKMRQFAATDELTSLVTKRNITPADLAAFGREIARVHDKLPRILHGRPLGHARSMLLENAMECRRAITDCELRDVAATVIWRLHGALDATQALLERRLALGYVRECHGDLHVSNVARIDGRLQAFDCLEFEPAFRSIDVAHEVAFLSMDLAAYESEPLASAFLNGWLQESGDYQACRLLNLFECHCALVRAKVAALNVERVAPPERPVLWAKQREFLRIAADRVLSARPQLILMHGFSGSGKSWLAERLASELPALWIRSDVERKRLIGRDMSHRSGSALNAGLYSAALTDATYARMLDCARQVLLGGRMLLVDATFLAHERREPFAELAVETGAQPWIIDCVADAAVIDERIEQRARIGSDPSEATREIVAAQRKSADRIQATEGWNLLTVHTDRIGSASSVARQLRETRPDIYWGRAASLR